MQVESMNHIILPVSYGANTPRQTVILFGPVSMAPSESTPRQETAKPGK